MTTGTPGLMIPAFSPAIFCKGVAQELGVVEADVGDDGKDWGDDVGAVESAAQSHFDDGIIHLLLCEVFQSHGSGQFEEGWMEGFEESSVLFYEVDDILLRNAFAVNSDTLSEIYQMGRGVESYLVTLALKDGSNGYGSRSLCRWFRLYGWSCTADGDDRSVHPGHGWFASLACMLWLQSFSKTGVLLKRYSVVS